MTLLIKKYRLEIVGALLCLTLGILSGYGVNSGNSTWYINLIKPSFALPNWIFAPVWTLIYMMMGVALAKIVKNRQNHQVLLVLFVIQFTFNLSWSSLFFYFQRIDIALLDIIFLWVTLVIFMFFARKLKVVFLLFLPYVVWVSFALALNFKFFILNA